MDRPEFAELLDVKIDTLRVWEAGKSKPRGPAAMKIVKIANRNYYPESPEHVNIWGFQIW
jgi:DNA-binding transcriptional regulator YiaG